MRNLENIPAAKLLRLTTPESLFTKSAPEAKREYRLLARRWHPDLARSNDAVAVFTHISYLYQTAKRKLQEGTWQEPLEKIEEELDGRKTLKAADGSIKCIEFRVSRRFEFGTMYIADQSVAFEIHSSLKDFYQNGCKRIRELKFPNKSMTIEMSPHLPQILDSYRTCDSHVLVLRKTPDQLLLQDVLNHFGGTLVPEHVGWILNVLYNITCYLQWSRTTHNAISMQTLFVSPLRHSGMLLGGWWYATPLEQRLRALPDDIVPIAPPDVLMNKRADIRVDLESIKAIGRRLLGADRCAYSELDPSIPSRIIDWLRLPSQGSAVEDYREWKHGVLQECFGPPRFVEMALDSDILYKEN